MNRRTAILTGGSVLNPTDAQIRNVQGGLCNLHDSLIVAPSSLGRPIFTPYFTCLPSDQQQDWLSRWTAAKLTHVAIMLDNPIYPEGLPQYNGAFYPAPSFPPTQQQFQSTMTLLRRHQKIPIVFTTTGEYPADLSAYKSKLAWLKPFVKCSIPVEGFEPYWTDDQFITVYDAMYDVLGIGVYAALHLPSDYIHNGGGPSDWERGGPFAKVKIFLQELTPPGMDPLDTVTGGWTQCVQRMNPPGTPGVPYYLENALCSTYAVEEDNAYYRIRDQVPDSYNAENQWLLNAGVPRLGNTQLGL